VNMHYVMSIFKGNLIISIRNTSKSGLRRCLISYMKLKNKLIVPENLKLK